MKMIIDILIKSIFRIVAIGLSQRMVAVIIIAGLEYLSKKSKNTIDDKAVAALKEELIKAGIKL